MFVQQEKQQPSIIQKKVYAFAKLKLSYSWCDVRRKSKVCVRPSFVSDSVCSSDWHLYLKRTSNAAYQFGTASLVLMDFRRHAKEVRKEGCFVPKRKVGRQKKSEKELTHRAFKSCHFS